MPDHLKDLYTYMEAFNKTQRGEVVEAFAPMIMDSFTPHGNDDYIVDGYDTLKRVDPMVANQRRDDLFRMAKDGRYLGQIANRMMRLYNANLRGVFEPRHRDIDCVPVEIKTQSTASTTNTPSLAQAIYLWLLQGKLMHVTRDETNQRLVVRKTDFSNLNASQFQAYVDFYI